MDSFLVRQQIHIKPTEKIILVTRKHWIKLARDVLAILGLGLFFLAILFLIVSGEGRISPFAVLVVATLLLIVWIALFVAWTDHYLDLWIVTNKRIIHIEQISLFHRTRSTLRIERIQNVTIKRKGVLEELFNFGSIAVETAGYKTYMTQMNNIPNPGYITQKIMQLVDETTDRELKRGTLQDSTRTP